MKKETEGMKKVQKATNVQFGDLQQEEIAVAMKQLGFTTMSDFIKFSCKQMCNMIEQYGCIPYTNKKKVVAKKYQKEETGA